MLIVYTPIRNIGSFPINKGNFFVPAAPAWKKINKKNRIHMDSPVFGATYPQKKRLKGPKLFFCVMSFPAASSLYCSFFLESLSSKNGLAVFCETSVRPDLTKKQKVEPTNTILKQITTTTSNNWVSCLSNHPSTILPFGGRFHSKSCTTPSSSSGFFCTTGVLKVFPWSLGFKGGGGDPVAVSRCPVTGPT